MHIGVNPPLRHPDAGGRLRGVCQVHRGRPGRATRPFCLSVRGRRENWQCTNNRSILCEKTYAVSHAGMKQVSVARAPLELNHSSPVAETATVSQNGSVFSLTRDLVSPDFELASGLTFDTRLKMDGLDFLSCLQKEEIPVVFLDPQYRGLLDKMSYGNEGKSRGKGRSSLRQMDEKTIAKFIRAIDRILVKGGHLFLWMDKFHLCTGFANWLNGTRLDIVDLVTWDKERMGMGYRTRRQAEYLLVLQKQPRRAKGVWTLHNIPDVWSERSKRRIHPHRKPVELQARLIEAVSNVGDVVIDPAAGSFSVMDACQMKGRRFLGCDIEG